MSKIHNQIPNEIFVKIFEFLPFDQRCSVCVVNKHFNLLIKNHFESLAPVIVSKILEFSDSFVNLQFKKVCKQWRHIIETKKYDTFTFVVWQQCGCLDMYCLHKLQFSS